MGTNNQQRRAAKQKKHQQRAQARASNDSRAFRPPGGNDKGRERGQPPPAERPVRVVLADAVAAVHRADRAATEQHVRELAQVSGGPATVERALVDHARAVLDGGWEPRDLDHLVRRQRRAVHATLLVPVVAAALATLSGRAVPARWQAQLADLGADRMPAETATGLLARFAAASGRSGEWPDTLLVGVELLALFARLPRLDPLGPSPSTWPAAGSAASRLADVHGLDPKVFERVRALLAKAESTTFTEEADAFTAKAQELMAKYAIDAAAVAAGRAASGPAEQPEQRRVWIDDPYTSPKAQLLSRVAAPNRCRTVFNRELGFSTVLGFAADLDVVDVLYTSLLVQASAAMTRAGSMVDRGGTSRTRSFRQSFLVSYAVRIGERLHEATATATTAARQEYGEGLLPVLASRDATVETAFQHAFPRVSRMSASASNAVGWAAGRAAADRATLGPAAPALTPDRGTA